jgi:Uma2 family endonuclease
MAEEEQNMATTKPRIFSPQDYERFAQEYLRRLRPEHFMEAFGQSTQRKITVESLDLVQARRPEVQVFSELLVQYSRGREPKLHQVVPDNMVVLHDKPISVEGSYVLSLQPAAPFWVLEYVSKNSKRKDYDENFYKYEQELKVPYYLIFHPDEQELTLFRHTKRKYVSVKPNKHGRLPLSELEMEMGLLAGWCRFWYCSELLPLPADLLHRAEDADRRAEQEKQRAEQEKQRAEQEKQRAEQEKQRAEQEKQRAEQEKQRAEQEKQRAEQEKQRADAAERELELLRAKLKKSRSK